MCCSVNCFVNIDKQNFKYSDCLSNQWGMKDKNSFVSNIIMQIKDLILFKLIMVATDYYDEEEILESIDFDEDVEIWRNI